jgi:hypothetical protein
LKRKVNFAVVLFILVTFVAGCGLLGIKAWKDLTPKQKAIFFMNTYLSTANNVDTILKDPTSTPAAKASASKDKATLTEIYPMIQTYKKYVDTGVMDVPVSEAAILKLVDKLVNKL